MSDQPETYADPQDLAFGSKAADDQRRADELESGAPEDRAESALDEPASEPPRPAGKADPEPSS